AGVLAVAATGLLGYEVGAATRPRAQTGAPRRGRRDAQIEPASLDAATLASPLADGDSTVRPRGPIAATDLAVLAALLMAVSYWHISLSRLGFRAVWVPVVVALALALLLRARRT